MPDNTLQKTHKEGLICYHNEVGTYGKDPNHIARSELIDCGYVITEPLIAIRTKCIDCCGGSCEEANLCASTDCPLWTFRMGNNPLK